MHFRAALLPCCLLLITASWPLKEVSGEAEAAAEAKPEAEPQWYNPAELSSPVSRPPYGGSQPPTNCQLTDQCCNMGNGNCCPQNGGNKEKQCWTVWERKCDQEDNPECKVRVENHCHSLRIPDCRLVQDVVYKTFTGSICSPKPMTKCFEYEKKVCQPDQDDRTRTISWENDVLKKVSDEVEKHCQPFDSFKCEERVESKPVTNQVKKQRRVPGTRQECRMVQKSDPGRHINVPIVKTVYVNQCYNIQVPVCSTNICGNTGTCDQGTSVCSQNDYNTQTVCPESSGPNPGVYAQSQNCQQVRQPVCSDNPGSCNPSYQQCCYMKTNRVCRQVPKRTTTNVQQFVPGQIRWVQDCKQVPFDRFEFYWEPVTSIVNHTRQQCTPITDEDCHNFNKPIYTVEKETKTDTISVKVGSCRTAMVKDRYCHTFSTGEIACRNVTVRKGIRINRIRCDQMVDRPQCFKIPILQCRPGVTSKCRMVPRQQCQDACSDSQFCNTCKDFAQGPGFGSCPTSTCGNFVDNQWGGNGGESFFPGYPDGGGGDSYYPGGNTMQPGGGMYGSQLVDGIENVLE